MTNASKESQPRAIPQRRLYSLPEARVLLGDTPERTFYRWEARGLLRMTRIGGRTYIAAEEIERLAGDDEQDVAA